MNNHQKLYYRLYIEKTKPSNKRALTFRVRLSCWVWWPLCESNHDNNTPCHIIKFYRLQPCSANWEPNKSICKLAGARGMSQKCDMWPPSHSAPRYLGTTPTPKHGSSTRTTLIVFNRSTGQTLNIKLESCPTHTEKQTSVLWGSSANKTTTPPAIASIRDNSLNVHAKCLQHMNTQMSMQVALTGCFLLGLYTYKNTYSKLSRLVMPWMLLAWVNTVQIFFCFWFDDSLISIDVDCATTTCGKT